MRKTAANVEMQGIEFQIINDSEDASKGLEKLSSALENLKSSIGNSGTQLSKAAEGIRQLKNALNDVKLSSFTKSIKSVANSLKPLGEMNFTSVTSSLKQLNNVSAANLEKIAAIDFSNLKEAADNAKAISGVSRVSNAVKNTGSGLLPLTDMGTVQTPVQTATMSEEFEETKRKAEEAISAVRKTTSAIKENSKAMKDGANATKAHNSKLLDFIKSLKRITLYRAVRSIISGITSSVKDGIQNLAQYSAAINSTDTWQANKTMSEYASTLQQVKNTIGAAVMPVLDSLLPLINSIADAFMNAVNAINQFFSALSGKSTFAKATKNAVDYAGSLSGATTTAKELKRTVMGFDELNLLNDNSSSGSGSGGSGGTNYSDMFEEVEISKDLLDSVSWIKNYWDDILEVVKNVGVTLLGWKMTKGFVNALSKLTTLSTMQEITIGIGLALTGFTLEFTAVKDAIEDGLDGQNFGSIVINGLLGVGGTAIAGKSIGKWIAEVFSGSTVAKAITAGGGSISTGLIGAAIGGIVAGIPMFVTGVYDAIVNGLNLLNGLLIPAGSTLAGAGIGVLIGSVGGPLGAAIGAAVGLVVDGIILIVQKWDSISTWFTETFSGVGEFFKTLWSGISTWAGEAWNGVKKAWDTAVGWLDTTIVDPIKNLFGDAWESISAYAGDAWSSIKEFFSPATEWFSELFGSVKQTLDDIFYDIGVIGSGCWEIVKKAWGIASEWFDKTVIQPVAEFFSDMWEGISAWAETAWSDITVFFSDAWEKIKEIAISAWEGIKGAWYSVATWFDETVIQPVVGFFSDAWDGLVSGAKEAWEGVKEVFSAVATFFEDIFTEAWEGIVKVFSPLGEVFVEIKDGVVSAFTTIVNGLIDGINKVVSVPFDGINSALKSIKDIEILDIKPFSSLRTISVPQIPKLETYATGGFPETGQLFIAREAGAEMVGSIGGRTAVANNDQIETALENAAYRGVRAAMSEGGSPNGGGQTRVIVATVDGRVLFDTIVDEARSDTVRTGRNRLVEV